MFSFYSYLLYCFSLSLMKSYSLGRSLGLLPDLVSWALVVLVLWVVASWVIELTVVVLSTQVGSHSVGNSEEVGHVLAVGQVLVKVVLEVLEHIHVLLNESVSSNSWEGEGFVIKLPGVDVHVWLLASLLHGLGNVLNVGPVSRVKGSGEHIDLVVELILSLIQVDAWSLNGGLNLGLGVGLNIGSGGEAEEHHKNGREFHPTKKEFMISNCSDKMVANCSSVFSAFY